MRQSINHTTAVLIQAVCCGGLVVYDMSQLMTCSVCSGRTICTVHKTTTVGTLAKAESMRDVSFLCVLVFERVLVQQYIVEEQLQLCYCCAAVTANI